MRIGFFTDSYLPTVHGVEISIDTFRKDLEKLGHKVFVYAPYTPGYKDKSREIFRMDSVRVIRKPEMRLAFPIVHDGNLRKLIDFKLDIVHAQTPFSMGLLGKFVSERQKIPLVYTHHTDYVNYAKAYFKKETFLPPIARSWSVLFSNLSDAIVAPSPKIKHELLRDGVTQPISIVPTGINPKLFAPTHELNHRAQQLKKSLGLSPDDDVIIFVGRMGAEKNVPFLLRSYRELIRSGSRANLLMVGDGPDLKKYRNFAKKHKLDRMLFTGQVPHDRIPSYYRMADLFAFPSLTETQGIVVLEALASGLPAIVLKDEAFAGVVADNMNGLVVPRHSPKLFADRMHRALSNAALYNRLSRSAVRTAREFSESKEAQRLAALYKKLL
ncbi:MAG: glycosyltransferase [Patescibacteria group bacterium]|nr:glycosyltransferase [Patescibacteria group bacterium]